MKRFSLLIIACLAGTPLQAAPDAAGRIVFSSGSNQIIDAGGKSRPARQGDGISPGDRLQTDTGHLQVRFADNGFISLKPKSQLVVSEFVFNGREDGTEKAFFNLLKGSMRAVTGLIGRRDRKTVKYETPVATIGIRGTAFVLSLCDNDCFGADGSLLPNGLYVNNGEGRIYIQNGGGTMDLIRGQFAFVEDSDSKPQQIMQPPAMRELFRDAADKYDFDLRAADLKVEEIRLTPRGLGELRTLSFALFGESDGTFPTGNGFAVADFPGSSIQANGASAVTGFSFDPGNGPISFNNASAALIHDGADVDKGLSWGVWESGHTIEGMGSFNSLYLHYIATDRPTPIDSRPMEGTARYSGSTSAGNVLGTLGQSVTGEFVTDFSINMDIDFLAQELTSLNLSGGFADGSFYSASLNSDGPTALQAGGTFAPLFGNYSDVEGTILTSVFGSTQFFFSGDSAQSVMGHYTLQGDASQYSFIGTYAVGRATGGTRAGLSAPETLDFLKTKFINGFN
jgi:hypothetical protein